MQQVLGGQYHLLERIGRGGMAEVWRAVSRGPAGFEKVVVIKRVLPKLAASERFVEMLVREAKIAARLSHANIVQIFDLGVADDTYFIAMEHVDGMNLAQLLGRLGQRGKTLPFHLRLHVAAEVAKALHFAHRQRDEQGRRLGIVHRDVSPANILLSREGEVKLTDFGIATARAQGLLDREKGRIRGKVSYMSPEQARAEEVDLRSDIFSLGVVLFELAAERRLFKESSTRETLRRVRAVDVPPLGTVAPEAPEGLARLVERALARDREDRYQNAGEMHADLSALIFSAGTKVESSDLGDLVAALMPRSQAHDPNKLAVDLLIRALDDATGVGSRELTSHPATPEDGVGSEGERTRAEVPLARRTAEGVRQVTLLLVRVGGEADRATVEGAIREAEGQLVPLDTAEVAGLFGYPKALENGPVRAVRAGVEARRRVEKGTSEAELLSPRAAVVRATLAMGPALLTSAGIRDLLNEATELLDAASPGEINVSGEVAPSLETSFVIRGTKRAGVASIVGPRRRTERLALVAAGTGSLVGREAELQRILRLLSEVWEGKGKVLRVEGEAGAGKTRLLHELRLMVEAREIGFQVGRCDSHVVGKPPFELLADLFRDICGIDEADPPEALEAKVRRLRHLGLSERETRIVGGLFGVEYPLDPSLALGSRPRVLWLLEATRKALQSLGKDQPVVVVLEDLQWLDESSADVVRMLARTSSSMRALLVLTQRPGVDLAVGDVAERMVLQSLPAIHVVELAAQALGAHRLEERLAQWLTTRTGGTPGFVVEVCRVLRDNGAIVVEKGRARASVPLDTILVPGSIAELAASTVDGLRKGERKVLEAAAVMAVPAEAEAMRRISQVKAGTVARHLRSLVSKGLLLELEGDGGARGARFVFRHGVMRQAVEEGLAPEEQKELHGRVAAYLEPLGETAEGKAESVARHLAAAGRVARAAKLLESHGDGCMAQADPGAAACHYARAANLLAEQTGRAKRQRAADLGLRAAEALVQAGQKDAARGWFAQARELADRSDARLVLARALSGEAHIALDAGQPEDAKALLGRALGVADALGERELAARASVALGRALMELGEPEAACSHLERAASAADVLGDEALMCRALVALASSCVMLERYDEAESHLDRVTERALRSRVVEERFEALMGLGELALARDDLDEAEERFQAARDVSIRHDLLVEETRATLQTAQVKLLVGKPGPAHALAADVSHGAESLGLAAEAAQARVLLGYLDATELGDPAGARSLASAVRELEQLGRRSQAAMGQVLLGRAFQRHGNVSAARRSLSAALELAGQSFAPAARRLATLSLCELEGCESE